MPVVGLKGPAGPVSVWTVNPDGTDARQLTRFVDAEGASGWRKHSSSVSVVRYVWLAILAVSLVPVAIAGFVANPLTFLLLGPERWRERVARLRPHRVLILTAIAACAIATAVYAAAYG